MQTSTFNRLSRAVAHSSLTSRILPSTLHSTRRFAKPAHGTRDGHLVNRIMEKDSPEFKELWNKSASGDMYELSLNHRQTCDIELILNGAFSPLEGFMTSDAYDGVVKDMRLPNGTLFPLPITYDISEEQALEIEQQGVKQILLRDGEHNPIAVMDVEDLWKPNKQLEAELAFGGDPEHPANVYLSQFAQNMYVGGRLHGFQLPPHYDHKDLRKTPAETRAMFAERGWKKICAFQTRNPMHRAHYELTKLALDSDPEMKILVHPVVGMTKPGDIDHHTRVKCYREIMPKYPAGRADCVVWPLAMRMAGPREAILHCIARKNYGCTDFILGRDHAGPGSNSKGEDFYGPYDARDEAVKYQKELGINTMAFEMMLYAPEDDRYYPQDEVPEGRKVLKLSGTEVRRRLRTGEDIPDWFSFSEVVQILRQAHPPRHRQGLTVFFTGLSGSGKSTIAEALREKLMELQDRRVEMLDGDYVRKLISSELGFSKEHRNLNIKRIGFISSMVANTGGIAIAAPIAPYKESRDFSRHVCSEKGGFCEVHISTGVDVCETRDRKGLYKKARAGKLKGMTGIDDPYEVPEHPEVRIDSGKLSVEESVNKILGWLLEEGYLTESMVQHDSILKHHTA